MGTALSRSRTCSLQKSRRCPHLFANSEIFCGPAALPVPDSQWRWIRTFATPDTGEDGQAWRQRQSKVDELPGRQGQACIGDSPFRAEVVRQMAETEDP